MPQPPSSDLIALVKAEATKVNIDPALACAIVEQESGWNRWAIRYEPGFYLRYEAPTNLTPTEKTARSISWGLFQTMGESVRAIGYKGDLAALCDPSVGVPLGLKFFLTKLNLAKGDTTKALLFWNGGGNPSYPSEVLARVDKYR